MANEPSSFWRDYQVLIKDEVGLQLFMQYLSGEDIHFVLEFSRTIDGFKIDLDDNRDRLDEYMAQEGKKILSLIGKKYFRLKHGATSATFNSSGWFPKELLETITTAMKEKNFKE